jgi:hypothetical protein
VAQAVLVAAIDSPRRRRSPGAVVRRQECDVIVGYKPGAATTPPRACARHYQHLPRKPAVIVRTCRAATASPPTTCRRPKPDGSIGTFNRNLPIAQLTSVEGVKFDITRCQWVGSAANETTILAIRADLPYKTFDELRKAKETDVIGSTGPGANTHDFPLLLKDLLGVNLKIVSGYSSSADIMLAVERKEGDGRAGSFTSLRPSSSAAGGYRPSALDRAGAGATAHRRNFAPTRAPGDHGPALDAGAACALRAAAATPTPS